MPGPKVGIMPTIPTVVEQQMAAEKSKAKVVKKASKQSIHSRTSRRSVASATVNK